MTSSKENRQEKYREYWDQNIDAWAKLYMSLSHGHEEFSRPAWFNWLYNHSIARYESYLMKERYRLTLDFIERNAGAGKVFGDIGCGVGVFSVHALRLGCEVIAIDFSEKALESTYENVKKNVPSQLSKLHLQRADITVDSVPRSDFAIVMGVMPYICDIHSVYSKLLPSTDRLLSQHLNPEHWANRLRAKMPVLNVRELYFHSPKELSEIVRSLDWEMNSRRNFGTGYLVEMQRGARL